METETVSQQCSSCDASSARCWCVDCAEALCDACVSAHRRVTLTRSHQILNQPNNQPGDVSTPPTKFCRLHPSEPFKLYCFTCSTLTCRDCQLSTHMKHRYQFISEAVSSVKQQVALAVAPLAASGESVRRSLQDMETRLQDVAECESHLRSNLQRSYSLLKQSLHQRMEDLLQQVQSVSRTECEQLQQRMTRLKELQAGQQAVTEIAEKAKNTSDMLTLQAYRDQIEFLLKVLPDLDPCPPQTMSQLKVVTDRPSLEAVLNCGHLEVKWIPFSVSKSANQNSPAASSSPPSTSTCAAPTCRPLPLTENSCSTTPTFTDSLFAALKKSASNMLSPSSSASSAVTASPQSCPPPTCPAPSGPVPTCPAPSGPVPTCPAPSGPVPTCPAPSGPVPTCPAPSGPVPTCPAPSGPVPTCPAPSGPVPTCPAPSGPVLTCPVPLNPASMLLTSVLTFTPPAHLNPAPGSDVTVAAAATKTQIVHHPPPNRPGQVLMLINPVQPVSTSVGPQPASVHGPPSAGPAAPALNRPTTVLLTNPQLSGFNLPAVPLFPMLLSQPSAGNPSLKQLKDRTGSVRGRISKATSNPASVRARRAALQNQTPAPKKGPLQGEPFPTASRTQASNQSVPPDSSQSARQLSPVVREVADSACSQSVQQVAVQQQEPAENEPTSTVSEEPAPEVPDREEEEPETEDSETKEKKPDAKQLDREVEESSPPQLETKRLKQEDPEMEDPEREDKQKSGLSKKEFRELQIKVSDISEDEEPETEDSETEDEESLPPKPKIQILMRDEDPETEDSERDEDYSPPKPKVQVLMQEDEDPETEDSEREDEESLPPKPKVRVLIRDEDPETEDSEMEEDEYKTLTSDREDEEQNSVTGHQDFSLSRLQPKVSLFRLPLCRPRPGRPHPGFRLLTGDAEDEIYLEEMSEDTQSRTDDVTDGTSSESPVTVVTVNCSACQSGNASVICTTCGRGYHQHCHVPAAPPDTWSDWMCALCRDLLDPSDPDRPQSPGLSLVDQRRCERVLMQLKVEGCSLLPQSGLDLLSERLIGRRDRYQTTAEFMSDVWSVFSDASQGDPLTRLKERVQRLWTCQRLDTPPRGGSKVTAEQEVYVSKLRETRKRLRDAVRRRDKRQRQDAET